MKKLRKGDIHVHGSHAYLWLGDGVEVALCNAAGTQRQSFDERDENLYSPHYNKVKTDEEAWSSRNSAIYTGNISEALFNLQKLFVKEAIKGDK